MWRSLSRWPKVFSELFVGLIKAGEVGGVLDESLNRLAQFLEEDQNLRRKVKAAMTYPVLVLIFAMAVVIGLVVAGAIGFAAMDKAWLMAWWKKARPKVKVAAADEA